MQEKNPALQLFKYSENSEFDRIRHFDTIRQNRNILTISTIRQHSTLSDNSGKFDNSEFSTNFDSKFQMSKFVKFCRLSAAGFRICQELFSFSEYSELCQKFTQLNCEIFITQLSELFQFFKQLENCKRAAANFIFQNCQNICNKKKSRI